VVDRYLQFVAARCRPNTVAAARSDLGVFFTVVDKPPVEVTVSDVLEFIAAQRRPRGDGKVVRLADGEAGLSARTIKRRVATVSGFFAWLTIIGAVSANPVPRGLSTRRRGRRSGVPLVRTPRTLPKVLDPDEVNALLGALRRWRDRAMVEAMVLGALRRCEVLGLRLEDLRPAERRLFIAQGKGGHQRLVPISGRFFASVARYLDGERPREATTDRVFVVLKGPRRGRPLSEDGLDEIVRAARARAGLAHATCHELRHTCLTRLREAGMALEAVQAQAGHRSIESTRIYLHVANDWLAGEYLRAIAAIDAPTTTAVTS
jgi:site-specific recombinase XerD